MNSLLFDTGDFLANEGRQEYDVHPFIDVMNIIGFKATVPRNHEFDYGLDFLKAVASGADFPFLSSNMRNALVQTERTGLALLSASAPLKAGACGGSSFYTHMESGDVTYRDIADLYPDTICAVCVSGAEMRTWLERSASAFAQVCPGQTDQWLLTPDFPGYNFDVIRGLSYEIDPTEPARFFCRR